MLAYALDEPLLIEPVIAYRHAAVAWSEEIWRKAPWVVPYRAGSALTTTPQNTVDQSDDERFAHGSVGAASLLAEKSLAEDWLRPEEDEAWSHLQ
ncbi:MAG: hypothetical protein RML12_04425 [Xanthomonadales bacterium]|nr:hypothetical protein [Xanthomonadales bacterium]